MKQLVRHSQGWRVRLPIYANRTRKEAELADFVDCHFRPDMTVDKLKAKVEAYIKTLPAADQARFRVTKQRYGHSQSADGLKEWFAVCVRYRDRWVVSISEPLNRLWT